MLYVIFAIIFLVVLLLFLPLKVFTFFDENKFKIKVKLCGATIFKFSPDKKKEKYSETSPEEKIIETEEKTQSLSKKIKFYAELSKVAARLAKKFVFIERISLKIEFGTSDAASTAVFTGVLWSAVYNILGVLGSVVYILKNSVDIVPDFNNAKFSAKGKCIIKSRLAYIIFIAIVIFIKIKSLKGKEE